MANDMGGAALRSIRELFEAGAIGGMADGELLGRFAARGDDAEPAFAALVDRHGPMVLRACRAVLGDPHEAEDAFQATFLILAIKAGSIRRRESLASWLHGVAHNVAASARAASARRRRHEEHAGRDRPAAVAEAAPDDLAAAVHEELGRLPERYRSALILCHLDGLTQHQAAARLGWPVGTVQSRLARGREKLRGRLLRRGLAPAAVATALATAPEPVQAAALAASTTRLALAVAGSRALASGAVPAAVRGLMKKGMRTMLVHKSLATASAALALAAALATAAYAYQAARPQPLAPPVAAEPDDADGLLTATGVVRMPDGSPAAGAVIRAFDDLRGAREVAVADVEGRFRVRDEFAAGCDLHAATPDGSLQVVKAISPDSARTVLVAPLELTLRPAATSEVTASADGRPVEGAEVVANGPGFQARGRTGGDGLAKLLLPDGSPLDRIAVWHPSRGTWGDVRMRDRGPAPMAVAASLRPPLPHRIRVIDEKGRPVAGVRLSASFKVEGRVWIVANDIEASYVATGPDGEAVVPWAPGGPLERVDVDFDDDAWKVDEVERSLILDGLSVVRARRERVVQGRLVMPGGADARGVLVTGFGFGPKNNGARPFARARRDGTFRLSVPSDHGFILGIVDPAWACDPWTGVILGKDSDRPAEIVMKAYPATPVVVKVTRGPEHVPVAGAWIQVEGETPFSYTDAAGEKRDVRGGPGAWLTTDARGLARCGLGKGDVEIHLRSGDWSESRTVRVTSAELVEVEFHRPWQGSRRVFGRPTLDGKPFAPSPGLVVRAWARTVERRSIPKALTPKVLPDGSCEVEFDAPAATLFVLDPARGVSGYVAKAEVDVDVPLHANGSYAGTLLDDRGRPAAGRTLEMCVAGTDFDPILSRTTDAEGRFRFDGVPSRTPLWLNHRVEPGEPELFLFDRDRLLEPGEAREGETLRLRPPSTSAPRAAEPLAKRVEAASRNARVAGMRVLVVLAPSAGEVGRAADAILDDEKTPDALDFVPVRLDAEQIAKDAGAFAAHGWPSPAAGEVVLIALDGEGKTIAAERIDPKSADACRAFLKRHRPPARDATAVLAAAREEAGRSGRRVWVVLDGPRCGPCFRLARWMEEHREELAKDYVVVRIWEGVDDRADEARAGLPVEPGDGVPWFAITEPDGAVLATSRGPLDNVGFPSSVEGVRHLRAMIAETAKRTTPEEVERLVDSLRPR